MRESRIRWTGMLSLVLALGLAACGGDANGNDAEEVIRESVDAAEQAVDEAKEATAEAVEAVSEAVETIKQEMPEGVTMEMIEKGKTVYAGAGICSSCHAPDGSGIPSLGANLKDDEWLHSDGSYDGITQSIMKGVTAQESSSGVPMPAKGGTGISDDDVKAVAAYVWTLSK